MARKKVIGKLRAIGYIRVSTAQQASEGVSLDAQENRIRAYCELHGLELLQVIVDAGESAKSLHRPGVQALLEKVNARQCDCVVIHKLDRLFRCTQDALNTAQDFSKRGVALCSISEQLDTSSAMGKFFFTLTAAFAEMERAMIAERTRVGLAQTRRNGKQVGCHTPYGYDLVEGRLIPAPDEQDVIAQVNAQYTAGIGVHRLAKMLTSQGVKTKAGKSQWYPAQIQRLLNRAEKYPV